MTSANTNAATVQTTATATNGAQVHSLDNYRNQRPRAFLSAPVSLASALCTVMVLLENEPTDGDASGLHVARAFVRGNGAANSLVDLEYRPVNGTIATHVLILHSIVRASVKMKVNRVSEPRWMVFYTDKTLTIADVKMRRGAEITIARDGSTPPGLSLVADLQLCAANGAPVASVQDVRSGKVPVVAVDRISGESYPGHHSGQSVWFHTLADLVDSNNQDANDGATVAPAPLAPAPSYTLTGDAAVAFESLVKERLQLLAYLGATADESSIIAAIVKREREATAKARADLAV